MSLKKYKNLFTSGKWSYKDPKDAQILALVVLSQKLVDDSKKSSEKTTTSNRESTRGDPAYIIDIAPWMQE